MTRLYDVVTTLWAQVLPLSAAASVAAGNAGATVRYRIVVRARADITTRHRFQDGARIYHIVPRARAPTAAFSRSTPRSARTSSLAALSEGGEPTR